MLQICLCMPSVIAQKRKETGIGQNWKRHVRLKKKKKPKS